MARSPSATLLGCYAHGELDSHNMWKERWEGGETRQGGPKQTPTFVVDLEPPKPNTMDASTCQLCAYRVKVDHFSTMI